MILLNIISTRLTKFKAFVKESILNLEDITHIYNKRAARGQRPTASGRSPQENGGKIGS
jgi:hypothetical protein